MRAVCTGGDKLSLSGVRAGAGRVARFAVGKKPGPRNPGAGPSPHRIGVS
ncbi:hypothetical protein NSU_1188 [Novosphingobium pentaromativorans US6-1]|uniref:Uncharacterized protein n=1 Tax=Novosphingobium pentaromativorans US6-1 TaxID=1088721 RepID=G6EA17_9SPHN|nr:hypothetical protein NSU_1188 [Novosphingobium pentaromativorans US6-1]